MRARAYLYVRLAEGKREGSEDERSHKAAEPTAVNPWGETSDAAHKRQSRLDTGKEGLRAQQYRKTKCQKDVVQEGRVRSCDQEEGEKRCGKLGSLTN